MSQFEALNAQLQELNTLINFIKGVVNRGAVSPQRAEVLQAEQKAVQLTEQLKEQYRRGIVLRPNENLGFQKSKKDFQKLVKNLAVQIERVRGVQQSEQAELRRKSFARKSQVRASRTAQVTRQSTTSEMSWGQEVELLSVEEVDPSLDLEAYLLEEKNRELLGQMLTSHCADGRGSAAGREGDPQDGGGAGRGAQPGGAQRSAGLREHEDRGGRAGGGGGAEPQGQEEEAVLRAGGRRHNNNNSGADSRKVHLTRGCHQYACCITFLRIRPAAPQQCTCRHSGEDVPAHLPGRLPRLHHLLLQLLQPLVLVPRRPLALHPDVVLLQRSVPEVPPLLPEELLLGRVGLLAPLPVRGQLALQVLHLAPQQLDLLAYLLEAARVEFAYLLADALELLDLELQRVVELPDPRGQHPGQLAELESEVREVVRAQFFQLPVLPIEGAQVLVELLDALLLHVGEDALVDDDLGLDLLHRADEGRDLRLVQVLDLGHRPVRELEHRGQGLEQLGRGGVLLVLCEQHGYRLEHGLAERLHCCQIQIRHRDCISFWARQERCSVPVLALFAGLFRRTYSRIFLNRSYSYHYWAHTLLNTISLPRCCRVIGLLRCGVGSSRGAGPSRERAWMRRALRSTALLCLGGGAGVRSLRPRPAFSGLTVSLKNLQISLIKL